MLLAKSIKSLGASSGASKLSFWGKIFGTEKDYYIVEASGIEAAGDEDEQKPADQEERGAAFTINEFAYYVTNSPSANEWTQLPDLTPDDVRAARRTKYRFSGDLERKIITNPFFFK